MKRIEGIGAKFCYELQVKIFSLGLLDADDVTATFNNLVSDRVPFFIRVNPPDVPAKNLPLSGVTHDKKPKKSGAKLIVRQITTQNQAGKAKEKETGSNHK